MPNATRESVQQQLTEVRRQLRDYVTDGKTATQVRDEMMPLKETEDRLRRQLLDIEEADLG